jgi:hypothetical protein
MALLGNSEFQFALIIVVAITHIEGKRWDGGWSFAKQPGDSVCS